MPTQLIADSGATNCEWLLVKNGRSKRVNTPGISPYFLTQNEIKCLLEAELLPKLKRQSIDQLFFYGTGLSNKNNAAVLKKVLKELFPQALVEVHTDLLAAARALCGHQKGMACILGTGSNSCYYNGKKIAKNIPSLGYIIGDEGSGAYLGKKVLQYYLLNTFDEDLRSRFDAQFVTTQAEILENVYRKALPNRYLASFSTFLSVNRGHFMVENILEDAFNDFFFYHLCKYSETWRMPVNFIGSIAWHFKDVLQELCNSYEIELGNVLQSPMEGLIKYHNGV